MKKNPDPISQLKYLVDTVHPLGDKDWAALAAIWQPFTAKRKEIITVAGEKEKYLYFVVEGVQRVYYFDEEGREATLVFTYPPSFGGVLDAMLLQQPSRYVYETLTSSVFLRALYTDLEQLMGSSINIATMIRIGLANAMSGLLERLVEVQSFSSEDKFRKLMQRSPHLLQLVPHKYIANYLGIDPTNFSKLINRIRI
ncbi:MAG: Crp/Fnr family transcriptional regulator [Taibaiella sp.]